MPQAVYIGVFSTQPETLGKYNAKTIAGQHKQYWYVWHGARKGEYIAQSLEVFPSLRGENDPNGPRVIPSGVFTILKEKLFRQNYQAESKSRISPPPPLDLATVENAENSSPKSAGNATKTALDMAELTLDDLFANGSNAAEADGAKTSRRAANRGYTLDESSKSDLAWVKNTQVAPAAVSAGSKSLPPATAAEKLDKVLRDDFFLHMTRYAKGRKKEALQAFSRILENTDGLVSAHKHAFTDFGRDLRRINLTDLAEKFYQRACELAPDDSNAAFNMARILFESGQYAKALAEVNRALELNPALGCARKLQESINQVLAKRKR